MYRFTEYYNTMMVFFGAMDEGCMEELEDIVAEQLGPGWNVDDLI